jgi:ADP-heptose:LPS heptosyltransferase
MRSKAFFINGGAGRVICSIPAFEKYAETHDDFIIVCEGGTDFYKGHPILHNKVFDSWHKGLFEKEIKHRDCISPEPYRIWEYYNQKCNLSQAFDMIINNLEEPRELQDPKIILNKMELLQGYNSVEEIKAGTGKDKVLVVQPFGRSVEQVGNDFIADSTSRSFSLNNIVEIINELKKDYAVVIMSEIHFPLEKNEDKSKYRVARPQITDMRLWASIINAADHFLGCDSMGQHIAKAFGKTATVVLGSTYPENISYPNSKDFDIIDAGLDRRKYSPIRISIDEEIDRYNDEAME